MALTVNTNMASINAQRSVGANKTQYDKTIERLSSGLRINRAGDDAAGLSIATKFHAQVRGMNQAVRNANNAISLVQTAEGGINTMTNVLDRLRELAVQASSDDNTAADRDTMKSEADNLIAEFTRTANSSEFNTMAVLDGSFKSKSFQIGANYSQSISFTVADTRGKAVGGRAQLDADVADGVQTATNANFGAAEFKVNGYNVAATNAADDQYSVLTVSSGSFQIGQFSEVGGSMLLNINGNSFTFKSISVSVVEVTAASHVAVLVSNINSLAITNVTARIVGTDQFLLEATGGTKLDLAFSAVIGTKASNMSAIGLTDTNLSGMIGSAMAATVSNYNGESSAMAKAVAINAVKTDSAVTATARANVVTMTSSVAARTIHSGDIYINGVNIGAVTVLAQDTNGALVSAINAKSADTGVTAGKTADGMLQLTAADGRNITVSADAAADATTGLGMSGTYLLNNSAVFRSTVRLNSQQNMSFTGTLADLYDGGTGAANDVTKTTATTNSVATDVTSYNVAGIDISTQDGAGSAILTIDAAIKDLNATRAQIGAIQNRLEFTISNLQIASENMSASESRIKDADFAQEVASMTKFQILQQAGTAMLAQANQASQQVMQLLR